MKPKPRSHWDRLLHPYQRELEKEKRIQRARDMGFDVPSQGDEPVRSSVEWGLEGISKEPDINDELVQWRAQYDKQQSQEADQQAALQRSMLEDDEEVDDITVGTPGAGSDLSDEDGAPAMRPTYSSTRKRLKQFGLIDEDTDAMCDDRADPDGDLGPEGSAAILKRFREGSAETETGKAVPEFIRAANARYAKQAPPVLDTAVGLEIPSQQRQRQNKQQRQERPAGADPGSQMGSLGSPGSLNAATAQALLARASQEVSAEAQAGGDIVAILERLTSEARMLAQPSPDKPLGAGAGAGAGARGDSGDMADGGGSTASVTSRSSGSHSHNGSMDQDTRSPTGRVQRGKVGERQSKASPTKMTVLPDSPAKAGKKKSPLKSAQRVSSVHSSPSLFTIFLELCCLCPFLFMSACDLIVSIACPHPVTVPTQSIPGNNMHAL